MSRILPPDSIISPRRQVDLAANCYNSEFLEQKVLPFALHLDHLHKFNWDAEQRCKASLTLPTCPAPVWFTRPDIEVKGRVGGRIIRYLMPEEKNNC